MVTIHLSMITRPVDASVVSELEDALTRLKGVQAEHGDLYVKIAKKVKR
jgi:hypothetical protein